MNRNLFKLTASLCLALWAATAFSQASYPVKPVKLVSPFPPGGSADFISRLLAAQFTAATGQSYVVEGKVGAGGNIGSDFVAKAPKDGYTLLLGNMASQAINVSLYKNMPYDNLRDFAPISMVASLSPVLVVNPNTSAKTVNELFALAKAKPGTLKYGSAGYGNSSHVAMEWLRDLTGTQLVHVPYKGEGPAAADVLGGQIDMQIALMPTVIGHIRSGKLRAVAVGSVARSALLPDVPTIAESGFPQFSYTSWVCLLAPAGTPRDVIQVMNRETRKVVESADFRERLQNTGADPVASSPEELGAFMKAEIEKWGVLVKKIGATMD
ncbi:MAG: tripartite tricarboxylate transporter substrate binding protein [Candidatus Parcubacteria bacterium]|nr:tripartite tricarboxylate transporter substrate binding protein [Burkholderiales bacterium]